jgi:hypothetical protein
MAALPLPKYGLENLFLFPIYQNRAQFLKATGVEAPEFDITRPPKYWFDPNADKSPKRSVLYDCVLAVDDRGKPVHGPDGKPYFEPLMLFKQEAGTVNLPIGDYANEPGTEVPQVPVPMRPLEPEEELIQGFAGVILVRNRNIPEEGPTSFSYQDRETIRAIARKLGVPA